jgi:hypothetical protein
MMISQSNTLKSERKTKIINTIERKSMNKMTMMRRRSLRMFKRKSHRLRNNTLNRTKI